MLHINDLSLHFPPFCRANCNLRPKTDSDFSAFATVASWRDGLGSLLRAALGQCDFQFCRKSVYFHELSNFLLPEEISARPICDLWHPHPSAPSVGNFIFSEDAQKRPRVPGRKEALHFPEGADMDDCNGGGGGGGGGGRALISESASHNPSRRSRHPRLPP